MCVCVWLLKGCCTSENVNECFFLVYISNAITIFCILFSGDLWLEIWQPKTQRWERSSYTRHQQTVEMTTLPAYLFYHRYVTFCPTRERRKLQYLCTTKLLICLCVCEFLFSCHRFTILGIIWTGSQCFIVTFEKVSLMPASEASRMYINSLENFSSFAIMWGSGSQQLLSYNFRPFIVQLQ